MIIIYCGVQALLWCTSSKLKDKEMLNVAYSVNFGVPKTATGETVTITGTVPIGQKFVEAIQLKVERNDSTIQYFSLSKEYDNSTGITDLVVNDPLEMAIVPQVATGEIVTMTSYGSLEAQISTP